MNVFVLNRRNIIFKPISHGMVDVIFVPGRDQVQIVRNIAGAGTDLGLVDAGKGGGRQVPLTRAVLGMKYVYGSLTDEITELSQPVRVWLAEDFVEPSSKAFFFVFSPTVIIHGIRESNDEGHISWRVAKLPIQDDPYTDLLNAISDYVISNSTEGLVVAVYNQVELYNRLQADLAPYSVFPVPFSKLKPALNVKPLYRHFDFTLLYITLLLFGGIILLSSLGYFFYTLHNKNKTEGQIEDIQQEIRNIQLNQNIGRISDPQAVLAAMGKATDIPPSSVVQTAADFGKEMGEVTRISFNPTVLFGAQTPPATEKVQINVNPMHDRLLVDQEQTAANGLKSRSWLRSIQRTGNVGESADLELEVQIIDASPEQARPAPVEAPTSEPSLSIPAIVTPPVGAASSTQPAIPAGAVSVSAPVNKIVSGTAVSVTIPARSSPTGPVAMPSPTATPTTHAPIGVTLGESKSAGGSR
jgi:hypothetical protein